MRRVNALRFKCPHCGKITDYVERMEWYKEWPDREVKYQETVGWRWPCCGDETVLQATEDYQDTPNDVWEYKIAPCIEEYDAVITNEALYKSPTVIKAAKKIGVEPVETESFKADNVKAAWSEEAMVGLPDPDIPRVGDLVGGAELIRAWKKYIETHKYTEWNYYRLKDALLYELKSKDLSFMLTRWILRHEASSVQEWAEHIREDEDVKAFYTTELTKPYGTEEFTEADATEEDYKEIW